MRILTVSDKVEPVLYSPYIRERVGHVDLILACGDLPYHYLEYIVGVLDVPLYYVHGNHDVEIAPLPPHRLECNPAGITWAENLHGRTVSYKGLLLAGLEGCRRYNSGRPFQYSEAEMRWQVFWLSQALRWNRLRYGRHLDILITHAPPRGIHDADDLPHQGFESYLKLLRRFRPLLMIHGHQHIYSRREPTESVYQDTLVLNTYGYRLIELAPRRDGKGWELVSRSRER
jgi:hypothetical protein